MPQLDQRGCHRVELVFLAVLFECKGTMKTIQRNAGLEIAKVKM